jgi:hypothetical protein
MTIDIIHVVNRIVETGWENARRANVWKRIAEMGAWFIGGFCTGLRGEEMLLIELARNTVMIKILTAIMASHLKRDANEDKKKLMLSRLAPEAAKLFDLLSARDWNNSDPKMNSFVKDLISDKDSQ